MRTTSANRRTLTIGTRASKLALAQTEIVRAELLRLAPDLDIQIQHITTRGDTVQDRPLSEIGGNGVFVTQIEEALRAGLIDLAVHSAKDLSSRLPDDMALAAFLPRADPRDVLVSRDRVRLTDLPPSARVGTSSPRRACQISALRSDLVLLDIRGNVDTRLRKLDEGQYDAIVLAAAGLKRLGLAERATEWFDPTVMLPAVGQGALAIEVRAADEATVHLTARLNDTPTATVVRAERAFLAAIGGSCSLPVGAYATLQGDWVLIRGMIGGSGGRIVRGEYTGDTTDPESAGVTLAARLLDNGGRELIEAEEAARP
jgi:hydroxymethylbilane synthase